jgi:ABC-type proline/glycine betaine transport system permease subunit
MDIFSGIANGLEAMVKGLSNFTQEVEHVLSGLINAIERAYRWTVDITIRVKKYLIRLIDALVRCICALLKLILFYVPTIVCVIIFANYPNKWGWLIFAILWFLLITAVSLTYGKEKKINRTLKMFTLAMS